MISLVKFFFFFHLSQSSYPVPTHGKLSICFDNSCLNNAFRLNDFFVVIATTNIEKDGYLSIYLGYLMHLFNRCSQDIHFLVSQTNSSILEGLKFILENSPNPSALVVIENEVHGLLLDNLTTIKNISNMILHLNHEQPWESGNHLTYTSETTIIRNYYYKPYLTQNRNHAYYIPAGIPMYGYIIGNSSSSLTRNKLSSLRLHYCLFSGRTNYLRQPSHHQANERQELLEMEKSGELWPCQFVTGNDPSRDYHHFQYEEYISIMSEENWLPNQLKFEQISK
jgi:hypothetical protein